MNPVLKTSLLLASLTALLGVVGYLLGGTSGLLIFLVISLVTNVGAYWFSDQIALSMAGAQPLTESQLPWLFNSTREMAAKLNIPMPRIFISPQMQPNAFATGRSPAKGVVAVTQGLLQSLSQEEVMGVVAHELAHIKNRDTLITTVSAVIAGAISAIANLAFFLPVGNDDENRGVGTQLLLLIVAPFAATLLQLAVSRAREYHADATAANMMGTGQPLASALVKISETARAYPMQVNPALASLYIANPLSGQAIMELFSTHPSTESRVMRLQRI